MAGEDVRCPRCGGQFGFEEATNSAVCTGCGLKVPLGGAGGGAGAEASYAGGSHGHSIILFLIGTIIVLFLSYMLSRSSDMFIILEVIWGLIFFWKLRK